MHELSIKILFIHITDKKNYCNIGMRLFNFLIILSLVYYYCIDLILFPTLLCPYPFYFSKNFLLLDSFCILCDSGNVTMVSKCDTSFFFYKLYFASFYKTNLMQFIFLLAWKSNMISYKYVIILCHLNLTSTANYLMYFLHLV